MNRKRLFIMLVIIMLLITILLVGIRRNSTPSITVFSSSVPVKLQLNDKTYMISKDKQTIKLTAGSYDYRAASDDIELTGSFDLSDTRQYDLNLNFEIFTTEEVYSAMCSQSTGTCPFDSEDITVQFLENNQWVVVDITPPELERAKAVLKLVNGEWELIDGPGTDIEIGGFYPESVEEVLTDE